MPSNNFYLSGFMGSGKTTIGKLIARKLDRDFLDLDHELKKQTGHTPTAIFELHGEKYFRSLERNWTKKHCGKQGFVISLGGGTILDPVNLTNFKNTGTIIYLKAHATTVLSRVSNTSERSKRPLIQAPSYNSKLTKIRQLLRQRKLIYERSADITIATDNKSPDEIASTLVRLLGP